MRLNRLGENMIDKCQPCSKESELNWLRDAVSNLQKTVGSIDSKLGMLLEFQNEKKKSSDNFYVGIVVAGIGFIGTVFIKVTEYFFNNGK